MSYWKSKVLPRIKKYFDKGQKKGASEACKSFESSKDSLEKEIVEKTSDLHPKVIEIYRSSIVTKKKLLKEPNEAAIKGDPDAAQSILQELATAGFPGAQLLSDAAGKFGAASLPGPIAYILTKTSTFLVEEPLPEATREIPIEDLQPPATPDPPPAKELPETSIAETGTSNESKVDMEEKPVIFVPVEVKKELDNVEIQVETLPLEETKAAIYLDQEQKKEKVDKEENAIVLPLEEKKEKVDKDEKPIVVPLPTKIEAVKKDEKVVVVPPPEEKKEKVGEEEREPITRPLDAKIEKVEKEEKKEAVIIPAEKKTIVAPVVIVEEKIKVDPIPSVEKKEKMPLSVEDKKVEAPAEKKEAKEQPIKVTQEKEKQTEASEKK